jgi:hypothetical protein
MNHRYSKNSKTIIYKNVNKHLMDKIKTNISRKSKMDKISRLNWNWL